MTARTLPQRHCRNQADHPTHSWNHRWDGISSYHAERCPGRYTPSAHRMPDPSPAQPADPFAGIPGAYED